MSDKQTIGQTECATNKVCRRCLIRAVDGSRPCNDYEKVEQNAERTVTPTTMAATVVSISHRYLERAQASNNSAACSINGNDPITWSKYQALIPFSFRWRSWLRSMAEPRKSIESYRLNHCFPSIASKAARRDAARLAYNKHWTWMIACGGPVHCGKVGASPPKVVLSILWMRTRRRAAVSSLGSDWSWGWTWMMNADATAENRPAWA